MDEIFIYPENDCRSYLEHHGTPGQKWGVRKAAWYPIAAFQKASNKVGTKAREFREKRAAEKKKKQRAANLQKAREARAKKAQETKDFEAEKKRILTSGTPGEIVKISSRLTNQEIQDALNRNRNLEQLRAAESTRIKDIKEAEFAAKYEKLDKIAKTVNKGVEYANTAKSALEVYNGIKKLLKDDGPETSDIDAILKNPKNFNDEQVKNAAARLRNLKSMGYGQETKSEAKPQQTNEAGDKKPNESSTKQTESYTKSTKSDPNNKSNLHTPEDSEPRSYTKNVNSDPNAKQSHHDYEQSGSKRSNVIDGEWRDVMSSDQVSTALAVVNRPMSNYNIRNSNTMKLLESRNTTRLQLEDKSDKGAGTGSLLPAPKNPNSGSGAAKYLLEDKSGSRTNSFGQLLLEDKGGSNSALNSKGQKLLTQKIDTDTPVSLSSERIDWLMRNSRGK